MGPLSWNSLWFTYLKDDFALLWILMGFHLHCSCDIYKNVRMYIPWHIHCLVNSLDSRIGFSACFTSSILQGGGTPSIYIYIYFCKKLWKWLLSYSLPMGFGPHSPCVFFSKLYSFCWNQDNITELEQMELNEPLLSLSFLTSSLPSKGSKSLFNYLYFDLSH